MIKTCFSCQITKPANQWGIARNRPDGLSVYCKQCTSHKSATKYATLIATKTCKCGTIFRGLPNRTYCSPKCRKPAQPKPTYQCKECSQSFQPPYPNTKRTFCSLSCRTAYANHHRTISLARRQQLAERARLTFTGRRLTLEQRQQRSHRYRGANSHFWRGGIAPINKVIRSSTTYAEWRATIFQRDDYTCQLCNKRGGKLQADHIKAFSTHPHLRFNVDNGRTLCIECHKLTPNYGRKALAI